MTAWLLPCIFTAGIVVGLVVGVQLALAAGRLLKLHICHGHLEHERELQNPNLVHPTPTR